MDDLYYILQTTAQELLRLLDLEEPSDRRTAEIVMLTATIKLTQERLHK